MKSLKFITLNILDIPLHPLFLFKNYNVLFYSTLHSYFLLAEYILSSDSNIINHFPIIVFFRLPLFTLSNIINNNHAINIFML